MKPRFEAGLAVRVVESTVAGHVRTPGFIRGKRGVIERVCGSFRKPEELAYGRWDGAAVPLYRVRFAQHEVWPDYRGHLGDTIDVEVYEHWLEAEEV